MEGNQFPDRCLNWLASREGSVRRPFVDGSGRPGGQIIETQLIKKLAELANAMVEEKVQTPSLILLAGGAGNGKSEALEFFLKQLARGAADPEAFVSDMRARFESRERAIDIPLHSVCGNDPSAHALLRVVQDASEGDQSANRAGTLLLQDIKRALDGEWTLACCVNRGILESARAAALQTLGADRAVALLNLCIKSLNRASRGTSCWPLDHDVAAYIWPMDIESLAAEGAVPINEIIRSSVDENEWSSEVISRGGGCVLAQNRERLMDEQNRKNLARFLYGYEVVSASLWSFRNIFSLVGFLLSGGSILRDHEAPTAFSSRLSAPDSNFSSSELIRVRLDRLRASYEQQLFPLLPEARWMLEKVDLYFKDIPELVSLAKYLNEIRDYQPKYSIEKTIAGQWSAWLDPARARSEVVELIINRSIRAGIEEFVADLSEIERKALESLADCEEVIDESLSGEADSREDRFKAGRALIWFLRRLAATFIKRSLGVRNKLADSAGRLEEIHDFLDRCSSEEALGKEAKLLERLFGDQTDDFEYVVRVDHVVGQPSMESVVNLAVGCPTIETAALPPQDADRPVTHFREFLVKSSVSGSLEARIPYDFSLFQRLRAMEKRLLDGCIDPMLRGVLDQARVSLDGLAVRGWGNHPVQVSVDSRRLTINPTGQVRVHGVNGGRS